MKLWCLLSAACLSATPAGAQETARLPDVRPGSVVRVEATTVAERLEGAVVRYTPDSLVVSSFSNGLVTVPTAGVTALWVRGTAAKRGAIIGGIAGAVVGSVVLEILCEIGASDDGVVGNEGFQPGCLALGAGVGGLVGGGTGAGIGALIPRWRLRFRAP